MATLTGTSTVTEIGAIPWSRRDSDACEARRWALFAMLTTALPDGDRVLASRALILRHLHQLGLRTLAGRPITWSRVSRWASRDHFPLLRGQSGRRRRFASVTSQYAVTAWILSRPANATPGLSTVWAGPETRARRS